MNRNDLNRYLPALIKLRFVWDTLIFYISAMINRIGKIYSPGLAVLFLLIFTFAFLHSELDQFSSADDDHASHDYCQLVQRTIVECSQHNIDVKHFPTEASPPLYSFEQTSVFQLTFIFADHFEFNKRFDLSDSYLLNQIFII